MRRARPPADDQGWQAEWRAEFSAVVRAEVIARDTPPGMGRPFCVPCGEPVTGGVVHVHHLLYKSRGGDGRPSNGIVVHGDGQAAGCHRTAIHDHGTDAAMLGWARSRHARDPYGLPVHCARRGWIVLLDEPGADGLLWRTEEDPGGD